MMKKRILSICLMLLIFTVCTVPAFASSSVSKQRLVDDAELLTSEEQATLSAKLDEISERQEFDVVIVTKYGLDGKTPQEYADDFFDYNGYGFGESYDGALLLLDMQERAYHISTSGYGITALTDYGMDLMEQSFVPKLSSGSYYDAFTDFANQCDYYVTRAKEGDIIDVPGPQPTPEPAEKKKNPGLSAVIAAVIGFFGGLIRTNGMKSKLKTVRKQQSASRYVRDNSVRMRVARDDFMYKNVTRTPKPKEREHSSSGGSSTHISSSGHTHGGSGGHF